MSASVLSFERVRNVLLLVTSLLAVADCSDGAEPYVERCTSWTVFSAMGTLALDPGQTRVDFCIDSSCVTGSIGPEDAGKGARHLDVEAPLKATVSVYGSEDLGRYRVSMDVQELSGFRDGQLLSVRLTAPDGRILLEGEKRGFKSDRDCQTVIIDLDAPNEMDRDE